jgi:muconolactone D-isomerase
MEFLVRIEIAVPEELGDGRAQELSRRESERAGELAAAGVLLRLWRVPGRRANVGVWSAPDATELHAALTSLPLFPYMRIEVEPLARHPSDPQR